MKSKKILSVFALTLTGATLLSGCAYIPKSFKVVNINDGEDSISLGYANFVARYNQALYDQFYGSYYGNTMWSEDLMGSGNTLEEDVKDQVMDDMEEAYLCAQHASDYDIELTEDEKAAIEEAAKKFMEANSDEAIEQVGATEDYVIEFLTNETITKKVQAQVEESAEVEVTDEEAAQKAYSYVYFATTTTDSTTYTQTDMTDEEKANVLAQATAVAAADDLESGAEAQGTSVSTGNYGSVELSNAEQYKEYSAALEEDSDAADDYEDAVVNYSGLDYSVLEALEGMSVGETSDVIEVEGDGYYVVRLDSTYDEEATATEKETLLTERQEQAYDDLLKEWKDATDWDVNDTYWSWVEFSDFFEQLETTDTEETEAE
jgi:foldase protein PrsA